MTIMLGKVSCDLHKCTSRVRVSIYGSDGIPLSVKASLNNFPRALFKKGVTVEVEQNSCDGRKFCVTEVYTVLRKPVIVGFHNSVNDAKEFGRQKYGSQNWKEKTVEKVKFYLNSNYFDHHRLKIALGQAFNFQEGEFLGIKARGVGVSILCTTDQFARFLIYRNQNGIKNGFMDLDAKLIKVEKLTFYDRLSALTGVDPKDVREIITALNLSVPVLEEHISYREAQTPRDCAREIDVSDR